MVMKGFEKVVEISGASKPINIVDLSKDFDIAREYEASFVVDGTAFMSRMYKEFDWSYGGQFREYVRDVKEFVKVFARYNISLIFVFENLSLEKYSEELQNTQDAQTLDEKTKKWGRSWIEWLTRHVLANEENCQVKSFEDNLTMRVVKCAKDKYNMGVIGQDGRYIFYNPVHYISLDHLSIPSLTSVLYDGKTFVKALGTTTENLPIIGALIEGFDDYKRLYFLITGEEVCRVSAYHVFKSVCYHVKKRQAFCSDFDDLVADITSTFFESQEEKFKFSSRIRRYCDHFHLTRIVQPDFSEKYYRHIVQWRKFLHKIEEKFSVGQILPDTRNIIVTMTYTNWECIVHEGSSVNGIYAMFRQRLYSIIFQDLVEIGQRIEVKETYITGAGGETVTVNVERLPESALFINPFNLRVSNDLTNPKLYSYVIGGASHWLDIVPSNFLFPCSVVLYMHFSGENFPHEYWELQALAVQAFILTIHSETYIPPTFDVQFDERVKYLARIFIEGCRLVQILADYLEIPVRQRVNHPHNYFDGKFFHYIYLRMKQGEGGKQILKIYNIEEAYRYIDDLLLFLRR